MYKIIAVDDEMLALKRFEHLIQKEPRFELLGTFTDPFEALEFIKNNTVDMAFLDIEMPDINGLEFAERILEVDPLIALVFLTAYDQYALEAFKAHATGYLLKPLDINELSRNMDSYEKKRAPREVTPKQKTNDTTGKLIVKCIGQFSCYVSGHEDEPISFRTAKTAELMALLIHNYRTPMPKYSILDALFPDTDYEKSNKLFYVSSSYLRSAFGKYNMKDIIIRENDSYRINTNMIDCDYINLLKNENSISHADTATLEKLANYCTGEYLMGKSYEWAFETRAYIDTLSRKILSLVSNKYIESGRTLDAIHILEKILILDPCNEEIAEKLIRLYINNNQMAQARATYNALKTKLIDQFGLEPSSSISSLIS